MIRIFLQNRFWEIGFRVMPCFIQVVFFQNELQLLGGLDDRSLAIQIEKEANL